MSDLDLDGHAAQGHEFVTPVEWRGFAGSKPQGNESRDGLALGRLSAFMPIAAHPVVAAVKALALQLLKEEQSGALLAAGQIGILGQARQQALRVGTPFRQRLGGAGIGKLGLLPAPPLLEGVTGQGHLRGNLADGVAVALVGAADLPDGFHVQPLLWEYSSVPKLSERGEGFAEVGPFWTPIRLNTGSLLHACSQIRERVSVEPRLGHQQGC